MGELGTGQHFHYTRTAIVILGIVLACLARFSLAESGDAPAHGLSQAVQPAVPGAQRSAPSVAGSGTHLSRPGGDGLLPAPSAPAADAASTAVQSPTSRAASAGSVIVLPFIAGGGTFEPQTAVRPAVIDEPTPVTTRATAAPARTQRPATASRPPTAVPPSPVVARANPQLPASASPALPPHTVDTSGSTALPVSPTVHGETFPVQVVRLINAQRELEGLKPLVVNAVLSQLAQAYSVTEARIGGIAHIGPDNRGPDQRLDDASYHWTIYRENLAAGQPTPEDVVAAWLQSPEHRANMMCEACREIGIGWTKVADDSSGYGNYWVMDIGSTG